MRNTLRFLLSLAVALVMMVAARALVATVYTVETTDMEPYFEQGDRILVNRWSYGLRTGVNDQLFSYARLLRQPVKKGDLIAFEDPNDPTRSRVQMARCQALPGDTIRHGGRTEIVPSLKECAEADYYFMLPLTKEDRADSGFYLSERYIIGRAVLIVYNHANELPIWEGFRNDRLLLKK